jgi:hypothetical protein
LPDSIQHKESLQKLLDGQLNDEVMIAILELVEKTTGRSIVRAIPSLWMATETPNMSRYRDTGSAVIVMPVHMVDHWAITIIDDDRSMALIYDSLPVDGRTTSKTSSGVFAI